MKKSMKLIPAALPTIMFGTDEIRVSKPPMLVRRPSTSKKPSSLSSWPSFLSETPVSEPTILLGDNQQAGKWSREDMVTSGNRFIERQYYKVRDWIRTGVLESRYVNTRVNCSDLMTKAVSVETATELGGMLSGTNSLPPIPEREDSLQRF